MAGCSIGYARSHDRKWDGTSTKLPTYLLTYTVDRCPLTESEGELQSLDDVEDNALNWLETTALAK